MKPPTAMVLGDQRVRADLAHVLAQRRLLVLDDVEHLPRRVHVRRRRSRGRGARPAVLVATAQRVCGMTRTRSTPSRCTPRTIASRAASVTRPPGLRKIFASPGFEADEAQWVDPGVHAGHHRDPRMGDPVELLHGEVLGVGPVRREQVVEVVVSVTGDSLPGLVQQADIGGPELRTWLGWSGRVAYRPRARRTGCGRRSGFARRPGPAILLRERAVRRPASDFARIQR